jgi:Metallo-peptidase family M12
MKKLSLKLIAACLMSWSVGQAVAQSFAVPVAGKAEWTSILKQEAPATTLMRMHPRAYNAFRLDEPTLKARLFALASSPDQAEIFSLPMGDGSYRDFRVWEASMMPQELAAKYPDIKTFNAVAVDDQRITAKLDFTLFGFHAMVFGKEGVSFIDPYDNQRDGYYFAHYKKDEFRAYSERMQCIVGGAHEAVPNGLQGERLGGSLPNLDNSGLRHSAARTLNGWTSRTYRLALSADTFYCHAATGVTDPTIAQALSCMTTSMNRINGVYNREFSVQMNFVTHEDTLIYGCAGHTNGADPFIAIDNNPNSCLTTNQSTETTRIGTANFDIGHVFTTGGGGLSMLGVVCNSGTKAQSVTGSPTPVGDGYDIDYVAHEMGHEYGSNHTFNNNVDGSRGGNAVNTCAYEPASGGTIMEVFVTPMTSRCTAIPISAHLHWYRSQTSWFLPKPLVR